MPSPGNERVGYTSRLAVIKVGGGLARIPGALEHVSARIAEAGAAYPLVVVPGGGPFADAVRVFDAELGLSSDTAHWMAILAMDLYGHILADRIRAAELVDEPGAISEVVCRGKVAVLTPYRWMRAADVLPHTWGVTSDSIAAFIAGALDAERLVLIKPVVHGAAVDPYFDAALPVRLPYRIMPWDTIERLESWLSE
jgi:5-(aminomethyl)-3-furanmethanol phosphate kinase